MVIHGTKFVRHFRQSDQSKLAVVAIKLVFSFNSVNALLINYYTLS